MRWTKAHSRNAVAAKARKRLAEAGQEWTAAELKPAGKVFRPHRLKPDFIVRIESKRGERLQVSIWRMFGRVRTADGQSARQFCRGLELLLTKSA